ncbi:MAG TPA: transporter [Acidobacteriota bacterium]|nr:transporter [Acidobacteriota bacterium]
MMIDRSGSYRPLVLLVLSLVCLLFAGTALAGEAGPGFRTDLGLIGGTLDFLGSNPFVLLFATLALGTLLGRLKIGFLTLGSTAATLMVGIAVSVWAFVGYNIRYAIPGLITTVFLNLFMFAVGLKVGPQFFAGLRRDGVKGVAIAVVVVVLNFTIAVAGAKIYGLMPGFAPGLMSGSMTDTAVVGVATSAVESGTYQPPSGVTAAEVTGNIAAAYAVTYLFSLIAIILLVRYLPHILNLDIKAAARAAEKSYSGGDGHLPSAGTEAAYALKRVSVDLRAYRVEMDEVIGLTVHDFSLKAQVPVLQILRGNDLLDLSTNPVVEKGDVITVVTEVDRLVSGGQRVGPEVADERARGVDLEVADLVITRKEFDGLTLKEATDRVRRALSPGVEIPGRLFHPVALIRDGEPVPVWPGLQVTRGDILRIIGQRSRINAVGKLVGATVRFTTESDVLTLALGLAIGYVAGTIRVTIGHIPFCLGAPAGVMLAGIVISALRTRNPLFGGPVSEGARSLLQALGLDVFIAVVAVNSGPNVAGAFTGGYVLSLLAIGLVASIIPPLVAWVVGRKLFKLNPAILLGTICGARHSTPALKAAQEESASAIPAVGYPVAYAVSSVLVLVLGYLALFL